MPVLPTPLQLNKVERELGRLHKYTGPITNQVTRALIKAIQRSVVPFGYTGAISGVLNTDTQKAIQKAAKKKGGYTGLQNGTIDAAGWAGYVKALQVRPRPNSVNS